MRILYITPIPPSNKNGGGRHCYANLKSILAIPEATIDYIGPRLDIDIDDIPCNSFRYYFTQEFNKISKFKALFSFQATSLGEIIKDKINGCDGNYDLVFIESTRCGFIFDEKYRYKFQRSICVVHNVELDYLLYNRKWNELFMFIFKKIIRKSEQTTIARCDLLLFLHEFDKKRFEFLYNCNVTKKSYFHPVCSFRPTYSIVPASQREKVILFMGSLDALFNEIAITKFLNTCWPGLSNYGYTLKIAGRNPSEKLIATVKQYQFVQTIANPSQDEMMQIIRNARMLILPDETGTGMKLRVAEAMSYGIPIVGTSAGLTGYTNIAEYGIVVDSIELMQDAIVSLIDNDSFLEMLSNGALANWEKQYNFEAFCRRVHNAIKLVKESVLT